MSQCVAAPRPPTSTSTTVMPLVESDSARSGSGAVEALRPWVTATSSPRRWVNLNTLVHHARQPGP